MRFFVTVLALSAIAIIQAAPAPVVQPQNAVSSGQGNGIGSGNSLSVPIDVNAPIQPVVCGNPVGVLGAGGATTGTSCVATSN